MDHRDNHPLHAAIHQKLADIVKASSAPTPWQEAWLRLGPQSSDRERLATALLGLDRDADFAEGAGADHEHPDVLLLVSNAPPSSFPSLVALRSGSYGTWQGEGNPLSPKHVDWPVIDEVAKATWKPETAPMETFQPAGAPPLMPSSQMAAATLIRQRRSCLALDGKTSIAAETFYRMLDSLLPRPGVPPWDTLPWQPVSTSAFSSTGFAG